MNPFKWLKYYLTEPAAYHCKPLMRKHEWRAPEGFEKFPVCIHCGKSCTWLRGYMNNSGTYLAPDYEAQAVADDNKLWSIPYDSKP